MLPLKVKDRPIVHALLAAGCCARCVLRFCCVGLQSAYRQTYEDLARELDVFMSEGGDKPPEATAQDPPGDPPCKKARLETEQGNTGAGDQAGAPGDQAGAPGPRPETGSGTAEPGVCVVCLGVLQHYCDHAFARRVSEAVTAEGYQFDSLVLSVSLPAQLSVREHSAWLLVKKPVRDKGVCLGKDDVIQVKEAYKWIMNGLVSQELGTPVLPKSLFEVSVGFTHPETDGDCHFLATSCSDCFKPAKNKLSVFTRMAVVKALEKISEENFRR
ncbi:hypothetical protein COCON_G00039480 [Conger conger]|uniref:Pus10 N-terminal eukaryotes domain-containing protein n=1 Tax=Conger conger TaxID=82655 RepID=A0A9Q1E0D2_CONCO|nr:hypothetical protein COCON_G00039480 [Conger conger]